MVKSKDFSVRVDGTAYLSHGDREAIGKVNISEIAMCTNQLTNGNKVGHGHIPSIVKLSSRK